MSLWNRKIRLSDQTIKIFSFLPQINSLESLHGIYFPNIILLKTIVEREIVLSLVCLLSIYAFVAVDPLHTNKSCQCLTIHRKDWAKSYFYLFLILQK